MPRFTKEADECENDFERWLYLIKNIMPFKAQRAVWDKLLDVADVASLNAEERARYDRALRNYRDYHSIVETAKQDGWKDGHEEGLEEGERKKQLEIARNLKSMGLLASAIQEATGLSEAEIQQL